MSSRKTKEEIQASIIKELDQGRNLVDYFIVIGPKPEIFKESWLYSASISELNEEYINLLSPVILSKFPPIEKKITGIDETLVQHCFPNGYQVEEHDKCPPPLMFSILLDNNNFSSIYPFKYVTCLKFYESISSYKKIKDKYSKILNDEISVLDTKSTLSKSEMAPSFKEYNSEQHINTTRTTISGMPRCPYRRYYLPKCICLVSLYPFLMEFSKIIRTIYNYSTVLKQPLPIEKIIENLTIEVPAPPRGIYSIEYNLLNEKLILKQNCMNDLPTLNVEFEKMFTIFDLNQILEIFKNVMLNSRIVFFSSNITLLTPIILTSINLVYPFIYPFNVVSILPREAYSLIDNISSVIVGINEAYSDDFFERNGIDISDMILVVDIDKRELKTKYAKGYKELPDLPLKAKEKLIKKINKYIGEVHKKAKEKAKENINTFERSIREIFLSFQIKIMRNYYKHLNSDIYSHQNFKNPLQNAFKEKEFLESVDEDDKEFYTKFIETQMFCDFIYKRMTPKEKREKIEILYFEEKIFQKNKSNTNLVFLNSKDYEIKKKYTAQRPKALSQGEISYFCDTNNRTNLFDSGIIVSSSPSKVDSNLFTYYIFPRIQSDFFFENNIRTYFIIENLNEELSNINADLIAKSHLNSIEIKSCEMENYIYLTWLKLWAFTFYYHEDKERKYRFNQMLNVLDLVINHEMDVFNNLFQVFVLNKADDELIFKLYERVLCCRLNPSIYIFDIIKHLLDKKGNKNYTLKNISTKSIINVDWRDSMNEKNFTKRTMKNKYDSNITKERVKFYVNENCIECKRKINLNLIMKKINDGQKDILWAKCPYCGNAFLPQLTIRFGNEMNKNGEMNITTSVQDEVVLYSPFTLYYTMLNSIIKENKIDVDNFKKNFNPIFWNLIWYFKMKNLPYDFFLPYERNINSFSSIVNSRMKNENYTVSYVKQLSNPSFSSSFKRITTKKKKERFDENALHIISEITIDLNTDSDLLYDGVVNTINNYVLTEDNYINPKNLVENSTIYCDTLSRMTETESELGDMYRPKGSNKYPLIEIKEDQNENVRSNMNTPFKANPSLHIETNEDNKEIFNFNRLLHTSSKMLSPMNANDKFIRDPRGFNAAQKSCKSLGRFKITFEKTPVKDSHKESDNVSSIHSMNSNNSHKDLKYIETNDEKYVEIKDVNITPTKGDYSINLNVVKSFRDSLRIDRKNTEHNNPMSQRFNTEGSESERDNNVGIKKRSKATKFLNDLYLYSNSGYSKHKKSYDKNDI